MDEGFLKPEFLGQNFEPQKFHHEEGLFTEVKNTRFERF